MHVCDVGLALVVVGEQPGRLCLRQQGSRRVLFGRDRLDVRQAGAHLDMIDLSHYGQPGQDPLGDLSVGVTTSIGLSEEVLEVVTEAAM